MALVPASLLPFQIGRASSCHLEADGVGTPLFHDEPTATHDRGAGFSVSAGQRPPCADASGRAVYPILLPRRTLRLNCDCLPLALLLQNPAILRLKGVAVWRWNI